MTSNGFVPEIIFDIFISFVFVYIDSSDTLRHFPYFIDTVLCVALGH